MAMWLGGDHGQKNRQRQQASAGDIYLRHSLPVARIRRHHGEIRLVRAEPGSRREVIRVVKADQGSIIEQARALENVRRSGAVKSFSELARKAGLTRHRARQLLRLLKLDPEIQNYIVKTRDENDRITNGTCAGWLTCPPLARSRHSSGCLGRGKDDPVTDPRPHRMGGG